MQARQAFDLIVRRGNMLPALIASPERVDHVEIIEIATREPVMFRDCSPQEASRLVRAIREDLQLLEAEEFRAAWGDAFSQHRSQ